MFALGMPCAPSHENTKGVLALPLRLEPLGTEITPYRLLKLSQKQSVPREKGRPSLTYMCYTSETLIYQDSNMLLRWHSTQLSGVINRKLKQ